MSSEQDPARVAAEAFEELFQAVYLHFHRRDGKRARLPAASRAVLTHLALTGPVTVGEAARHLDRAQSVVSEIVAHLVADGLLEREDDPADRRRTLVWLTADGLDLLRRDREVLSTDLLERAMRLASPTDRQALLTGLRALLAADHCAGAPAAALPTHPRIGTRSDPGDETDPGDSTDPNDSTEGEPR